MTVGNRKYNIMEIQIDDSISIDIQFTGKNPNLEYIYVLI